MTDARASDGASLRGSTVLVVDDEPESLELLRVLLVSQGYRVVTAPGSEDALQLVERGGVDLIVCDLMMSRMDGVELCAHVRGVFRLDLPIVFVTSLHDRASRIRAKEAGADDFLVKPVDGLELLVRVESLLRARARSEQALRDKNRLLVALAGLCSELGGEPVADRYAEPGLLEELGQQRALLEAIGEAVATSPSARERVDALAARVHALEVRLRRTLDDAERALADVARPPRSADLA